MAHNLTYHFTGVIPQCVEYRLINTTIDKKTHHLMITEFTTNHDGTNEIITLSFQLPREITNQRIIGQPICIGCKGDFHVFQFASVGVKNIQFFSVDIKSKAVTIFEDKVHYFSLDIMTISPIECHISCDRHFIILRLPQAVLRLHKQSNILIIKDHYIQKSKLLDKKFNCVRFHPGVSIHLLVVHVNDICDKCTIHIYDILKDEILVKKTCNINTFSFDFDNLEKGCSEKSGEGDDENRVMSLFQTAATFDKTSDLILLTCFPSVRTFFTMYGFSADDLESKFSYRIVLDNILKSATDMFSPQLSVCNTKLNVNLLSRHPKYAKVFICSVKFPTDTNLKSQARSYILRTFKGKKLQAIKDSLPRSLSAFLEWSH